jgi:hypothetical protein
VFTRLKSEEKASILCHLDMEGSAEENKEMRYYMLER